MCTQISHPPLSLLSAFFDSLRASSHFEVALLDSSAKSFAALYLKTGRYLSAEAWAEVWVHIIKYLASAVPSDDVLQDGGVSRLVAMVCDELEETLRVSKNGKKVSHM